MFLPVRFRLALLFGAVIFAVQGVCSSKSQARPNASFGH